MFNKMLNSAKSFSVMVLFCIFGSMPAFAALPTEVTDMTSTLATDFGLLMAVLWPLLALTLGTFILIKWVKRGVNKAT